MGLDRWVVERFHRVLVEEIRKSRPEYLEVPFTVAEIYQSLVPYRTHRDRIGVELNGDYEEALMHLLVGDAEYLQLDSPAARDRIRRELGSNNPNTGVFREFAALTVRLDPRKAAGVPAASEGSSGSEPGVAPAAEAELGETPEPAPNPGSNSGPASEPELSRGSASTPAPPPPPPAPPAPPSAPELELEAEGSPPPEVGEASPAEALPTTPAPFRASSSPSSPTSSETRMPSECPECQKDLPERDSLRFCPFCGIDVLVTACTACDEELDRSWSFCIACGTPAAA